MKLGLDRILDLDRIVERVVEAGFAAYVEQTGGGCATIYASREWEERPVTRMGEPDGTVRLPAVHEDPNDPSWPRHEVAAGPGWFEGPRWTRPRGGSEDFYVGPDDGGEPGLYEAVRSEDEAVAAILARLREEGR